METKESHLPAHFYDVLIADLDPSLRKIELRNPQDIDRIVELFRRTKYQPVLGYLPPLLHDKQLPPAPNWGIKNNLLSPETLSSAMFNNSLKKFLGKIDSMTLEVFPGDLSFASFPRQQLDKDLNVTLLVTANLKPSASDEKEGSVGKLYTLYISSPNENERWPVPIERYALRWYSRYNLRHRSILWIATKFIDKHDFGMVVRELNERRKKEIERSKKKAEDVERGALMLPFRGGLPSLGKR